MSLLSRLLERLGYVKLSEYGLQLESGRLVPTTHNHPMLTGGSRPYLPTHQRNTVPHQTMQPYPMHRDPVGFGPPTGPPVGVPMQPITALGVGVPPSAASVEMDFDIGEMEPPRRTPAPQMARPRPTPAPQPVAATRRTPAPQPVAATRRTPAPQMDPRVSLLDPPSPYLDEESAEMDPYLPDRVAGSQNVVRRPPSPRASDELALSETLRSLGRDADGAHRSAGPVQGELRFVDGVYETVDRRSPKRRFPVSPQSGARTVMAAHSLRARARSGEGR